MSGFDEREKAFENKYAHDEQTRFRISARTAKLYGLWAAGKMGLSDDETTAYAASIVEESLETAHLHDIIGKVKEDLSDKGLELSDEDLKKALDESMAKAEHQIQTEAA